MRDWIQESWSALGGEGSIEHPRQLIGRAVAVMLRVKELEAKPPCCRTARQLIQAGQAPTTCGECAWLNHASHDGPDYCTHDDKAKGFNPFVDPSKGLPPGCPRRSWKVISHKVST